MTTTSHLPQVGPEVIDLPPPEFGGGMSLAEALAHRRSQRVFGYRDPSVAEIAQLCWAAQGITEGEQGRRAAPSAGATYPVALFVVAPVGVYRYEPSEHRLHRAVSGDVRGRLRAAAGDQPCVGEARVCLVLAAQPAAIDARYGRRRGWRYALLETGHVAENILLQAAALDLVGVPVGAFEDRQVSDVLGLPPGVHPVYLLPIGAPAGS